MNFPGVAISATDRVGTVRVLSESKRGICIAMSTRNTVQRGECGTVNQFKGEAGDSENFALPGGKENGRSGFKVLRK